MSGSTIDFADSVEAPARRCAAVTPNDGADLPGAPCKALWIGVAGTVALIAADDTASVTLNCPQGLLPIRARRVLATGTTATSIVALR